MKPKISKSFQFENLALTTPAFMVLLLHSGTLQIETKEILFTIAV